MPYLADVPELAWMTTTVERQRPEVYLPEGAHKDLTEATEGFLLIYMDNSFEWECCTEDTLEELKDRINTEARFGAHGFMVGDIKNKKHLPVRVDIKVEVTIDTKGEVR